MGRDRKEQTMTRDDRYYAYFVAPTSRSRANIRRITLSKRWLKAATCLLCVMFMGSLFGMYGLMQQARKFVIERENQMLRVENQLQRNQLLSLNTRVDAVEGASRKLAEMSGVEDNAQIASINQELRAEGGPARPIDSAATLAVLEAKTALLEREVRIYERVVLLRGTAPSLWPVVGKLETGVGGRHNPFTGRGWEYHEGQDIDAAYGTPVLAAANGTVTIAQYQRGYGNVVYVDHGNGLSTRYGHLSEIEVKAGQSVTRGATLGKVGSTGRSTGPHLHYEVRVNNQPVNPREYLPGAEK
jgi:murein DD-endopeptidase MepM/ murein hydrolase activator NlpD